MFFDFHSDTPDKLNDPTWYALLRGVSGSVIIIICDFFGKVIIDLKHLLFVQIGVFQS